MSSNINQQLLSEILVDVTKLKKSIDELPSQLHESIGAIIKLTEEVNENIKSLSTTQNDLIQTQLEEQHNQFLHEFKNTTDNKLYAQLSNEIKAIYSLVQSNKTKNNKVTLATFLMVIVIAMLSAVIGGLIAFQYHDYKQEVNTEWGTAVQKSWKSLDKHSQKIIKDNF